MAVTAYYSYRLYILVMTVFMFESLLRENWNMCGNKNSRCYNDIKRSNICLPTSSRDARSSLFYFETCGRKYFSMLQLSRSVRSIFILTLSVFSRAAVDRVDRTEPRVEDSDTASRHRSWATRFHSALWFPHRFLWLFRLDIRRACWGQRHREFRLRLEEWQQLEPDRDPPEGHHGSSGAERVPAGEADARR